MSLNCLHLKEGYASKIGIDIRYIPFELNNNETIVFVSKTARQSLLLNLKSNLESSKISISAKDGYLYLTNHRLVYITLSQGDINDFSIFIQDTPKLQFSHAIKSPWFGANYWLFLYHSAGSDGDIAGAEWVEGSIKFLDGGLFEFVSLFDNVLNDRIVNREIDNELPRYSEL